MRADGDQHGIKAFIEDVVKIVDAMVELQIDAEIDDVLHFALDDVRGQAIFGHAQPQHAARNRHRFKHGDAKTGAHQVLRRGQAARPCADDRHALLEPSRRRLDRLARLRVDFISHKTLERADVDRLVHLAAIARCLAAVIADAPADAGERIVHLDHAQRIMPAAFADQGNVPLRALTGRAGVAARGNAAFLDGIGIGHGLRIELIGGAALG